MSEKLNKGFNIKKKELDARIQFETQIPRGYKIIPLKELVSAEKIIPMKTDEIEAFLRHIPLMNSPEIFPYKNAEICRHMAGPQGLNVAQRFILRSKLISILEGLDNLYEGFQFPGLLKRTAHYVIGRDSEERKVGGVYFPPLLEIVGESALLFDGNHRMSLCGTGSASEILLIKKSSVNPPYSGIPWHRNFVDKKPPLLERYVDFNPTLLKDFDYVGIDG
jgi:hypothetical protein|tara:strand:+ start:896 stop:1558 length:663 start_codon:yes stop_codon:yes gene_type:complete